MYYSESLVGDLDSTSHVVRQKEKYSLSPVASKLILFCII